MEENLELKRELDLRRKTESGLRFMQARLAKILDSLDDAIVGVNVSSEIAFCNQSFRTLVGGDGDSLLGHPLTSIMVAPEEQCAAELLGFVAGASDRDGSPVLFDTVSLVSGGESFDTSIWCNVVELEEETLCLLSVYSAKAWNTDGGGVLSSKLIRELSEDRQRFLRLEETMLSLDSSDFESRQQVLENVKAIDELLTGLCSRLGSHTNMQTKRSMSVTVVKLAVDCWTASTGTAKADMAEQSGLWNVYMERDGYFRTQTLDKYLDPELLPQKPRWQKVLATADFVLANCEEDSPCRRELEEATADFRALF
ncbi:MAG: PAS domain-containing protein [Proteobacteria bacterium]|nr:PAS domain-containing protein [Pseudomonadota bacterium]